MTLLPGIALYNPDRLSDQDFTDAFVARREMLAHLVATLQGIVSGDIQEHPILIGARGMGKSSLLRRLSIAIRQDATLDGKFMPLRFREEQYNVTSLDTFWRNCGEALASWCEANGRQALADQLDRAVDHVDWRDADKAYAEFRAICAGIGKRPVLLVDNLDLILDALPDLQLWALRRVLQEADGPVLVGAATHLPSQGADRNHAFYEFFQPQFLLPLKMDEVMGSMHALAELRKEAGLRVKAILSGAPERLRTLHELTGGNPRVLAILYQLLERGETETTFADLEGLLDQLTPYYKARIEEYATSQQRAVIDAIALNWDPITSRDLADATQIEVTTISSQLSKLRKDGFVEEVETSGSRAGYQISERFLNIWYLMRHGTRKTVQRLKWLTVFLTRFYSEDELTELFEAASTEGWEERMHPDYREAVVEAWHEVFNKWIKSNYKIDQIGITLNKFSFSYVEQDPKNRINQLSDLLNKRGKEENKLDVFYIIILSMEFIAQFIAIQEYEQAIGLLNVIVEYMINPDSQNHKSFVVIKKRIGDIYADYMGDWENAEQHYRAAASRNKTITVRLIWLLSATGRTREAGELAKQLAQIKPLVLNLLFSGIELANDNLGTAINYLEQAFSDRLAENAEQFLGHFLRLFRLAHAKGYGQKLLDWFVASGTADRVAPIYAAFDAYVNGERKLLDVNPEVRSSARTIYNRLDAPRRYQASKATPSEPKTPRGRTRKPKN